MGRKSRSKRLRRKGRRRSSEKPSSQQKPQQRTSFGDLIESGRPWLSQSVLQEYQQLAMAYPNVMKPLLTRFQSCRESVVALCQQVDEAFSSETTKRAESLFAREPKPANVPFTPRQRRMAWDIVLAEIHGNGGFSAGMTLFEKLVEIEDRVREHETSGRFLDLGDQPTEVFDCYKKGVEILKEAARANVIRQKMDELHEQVQRLELELSLRLPNSGSGR